MVNKELEKLAHQYYDDGDLIEAEKLFIRILASDTQNTDVMFKLAKINIAKFDYANAEMLLQNALNIHPGIEILRLLAYVKEKLFNYYDAIVMYEKILELEPSEELFEIVGNLYIAVELYDNAIEIAKDCIEKYPSIFSYRRLFILYLNLFKFDELKKLREEIKEKFPNKGLTFNLEGMYKEFLEKDYSEAQRFYEKAVKTGVPTAVFDLALCLRKTKKYDESEKCCKKIIDSYPVKNEVLKLLKEICFTQRKMRKGYKYYFERILSKDIQNLKNKWDGKSYPDKTLLLVYDIQNGEDIINLRYIPLLKQKFKNVILACPPNAEGLLRYNKIKTVSAKDIFETKYDFYSLLSEIPYYLNVSFENIPLSQGYLKSEKEELEADGLKVGLFWKNPGDSFKAIQQYAIDISSCLSGLFDIPGVNYYSLQKNDIFETLVKFPQIQDLSSKINDMEDYARYINSMDLIITIDSNILHLAGALNKKAIGIIPYESHWYWFDNDNKTEWYSSLELVKQGVEEDWNSVSNTVIERVNKYNAKYQKTK